MNRIGQPGFRGACVAIGVFLCSAGMSASVPAQGLRQHAADFWDELKVVVGEGTFKRLRIEYENDVFYATDSNYTNGVRLTWRAGAKHAVKFDDDNQRPWVPPLRFTAGGDAHKRALEDAECARGADTRPA